MYRLILAILMLALASSAWAGDCNKRDTLNCYPDKIDTVRFEKKCESVEMGNGCVLPRYKTVCKWVPVCDTTWTRKIAVYLTPSEIKKLMELLHPKPWGFDSLSITRQLRLAPIQVDTANWQSSDIIDLRY